MRASFTVTSTNTMTGDSDASTSSSCGQCWEKLLAILRADQKGWLVVLLVTVMGTLRFGIPYSMGVLLVSLDDDLGKRPLLEYGVVSSVPEFLALCTSSLGLYYIRHERHRGYRWGAVFGVGCLAVSVLLSSVVTAVGWLFVTYSVIYGIGSCLVYVVSALTVSEYFETGHTFHALTINSLRYSRPLAILLFNPVQAALIGVLGWRNSLRLYSVPLIIVGVLVALVFTPKAKRPRRNVGDFPERNSSRRSAKQFSAFYDSFQRPELALWFTGNTLVTAGYTLPVIYLPYYMSGRDVSCTKSAWILTLMGVAEILIYASSGVVSEGLKTHFVYANVASSVALTLFYLLLPSVAIGYEIIIIWLLLIAVSGAIGLAFQQPASEEVTDLDPDTAKVYTRVSSSVGLLLGPPLFGAVFDGWGRFDIVFYVASALYALQTVCFVAVPLIKWRRTVLVERRRNELDGLDPASSTPLRSDDIASEYGTVVRWDIISSDGDGDDDEEEEEEELN